jgi:kumamolisin
MNINMQPGQRAKATNAFISKSLAALAFVGILVGEGAMAAPTATRVAVPYPTAATPKAVDRGPLEAQSPNTQIALTIALKLPDLDAAEKLLQSLSTPGDPQYRQFLTAEQFAARFAPTKAEVARVIAALAKYGLSAEQTTATTLRVSGLPADIERAFSVTLHSYEVAAHGDAQGYTFYAPLSRATLPAEISTSVAAVVGLDNRPSFHPYHVRGPLKSVQASQRSQAGPAYTLNPFGYLTVIDFAHLYDVEPMYSRGITGRGRTVGVMSLANFTPSDAFAYWSGIDVAVNPNRIRQIVLVDGGPGAPSDASGSLETTLDVEQSGGVAPAANMLVYLAPNTNQGWVDLFATAIDANRADSLSISWGEWEWFDNLENSPVTDPITGKTVSVLQATHELLVRAAIQGQTVITAAGDSGAYEANGDLGCFGPYSPSQPDSCSLTLSVSYAGTDTAITVGGGTTLPGQIDQFCTTGTCLALPQPIDIPQERVWGWDYFTEACKLYGYDPVTCGIFPVGSGGGVSVFFGMPFYQFGTPGVRLSQPGQVFIVNAALAAQDEIGTFFALPAFYPGRNVPDVSFNADPYTGYIVYYTSEPSGVFGEEPGWGGTSFVAPQLNGVSALLGQDVHGRLGLLNYALYAAQSARTPAAPLHPITRGDNWFYRGGYPYSPAAGLGTLDVANFAEFLHAAP